MTEEEKIDAAIAIIIFMREMSRYAAILAVAGASPGQIALSLMKEGCPRSLAEEITKAVVREKRKAVARAALKSAAWSAAWIVGGIAVAASLPARSESVIPGLMIIWGIIGLFRTLKFCLTS